jgi:ribosomal protein L3
MKTCTHCKQEKPFEAFYTSLTNKSGYTSWCKVCESERNKAKNQANRERRLAKAKEWRNSNKDKQTLAIQTWREANKEHYKNYFVEYAKANRGKLNAKWMQRDAAKKCRTPSWLDSQMKQQIEVEYSLAAWCTEVMNEPYHVDHIVPLQGKTVSGLHVPWNLQVLPAKLNQQKSNHF